MKVGLFGDSYACFSTGSNTAWFENEIILQSYNLDSYAKKGSDISFSYNLFMNNHEKYEKNIFIVTESTRHTFELNGHTVHVSNIDVIDYIKTNIVDHKIKAVLTALKTHYLYTLNTQFYDFGLAGMIQHIKSIRPDTIIVYGFYNHSIKEITNNYFYLSQVSAMELKSFNIDFDWMKRNYVPDGRSSHMTDDNNQIFAEYMKNKLDGIDVTISLSDFIAPNISEVTKYFSI